MLREYKIMSTKLIVIEDDLASVTLLKRYLKRASWNPELHHFEYGSDAIEFFEGNEHLDMVLLLDLNLPDMGGLDILATIRDDSRYADLPVVILTTSNLYHEREEAVRLGVEHFLEKPFNFDLLISLMQKLNVNFASA